MNYQKHRDIVQGLKFKFSHHEDGIGYDLFTKGKEWKLVIFYGGEEETPLEIPRYWLVKDNKWTKFEGFINTEEEFRLVCNLVGLC